MDFNSIKTDLRGAFGPAPKPTDAVSATATPSKATPKIRMTRPLPEYACFIKCTDLGIDVVAPLPPTFTWSTSAHYDTPFRDAINDMTSDNVVGRGIKGLSGASGLSMVTQTLTAKFWSGSDSGAITLSLIFQAQNNEVDEVLKPIAQLMSLTVPRTLGDKNGGILQAPGPHFDVMKALSHAANSETVKVAGQNTIAQNAQAVLDAKEALKGKIRSLISMPTGAAATAAVNSTTTALTAIDNFARNNIVNNVSLQIGRFMLFDHVVIKDVNYDFPVQPVGAKYGYSTGNFQRADVSITFEPFFDLTQRDLATVFLDPALRKYFETLINRNSKAKF